MKKTMKKMGLLVLGLSFLLTALLVMPPASQARDFYRLPTAPTGGSYYPMGALLASLWSDKLKDKDIVITSQSSGGSVENCNMLASGEALISMAALDVAMGAHKGKGKFSGRPVENLRILSVLFPTYQSWGVTFKSGIKTMSDMKSKRILHHGDDERHHQGARTEACRSGQGGNAQLQKGDAVQGAFIHSDHPFGLFAAQGVFSALCRLVEHCGRIRCHLATPQPGDAAEGFDLDAGVRS